MCGIAGIISKAPLSPQQQSALLRAADSLEHRGPNDSGVEFSTYVGLAHTRLAIIDLAGGHQPLSTPDGQFKAVVNGEVYNHIELREAFAKQGAYLPKTHSDSEGLLQAFATHAISGLKQVNGMFAAAIHDLQQDSPTLVRDRLGIKPLYYHQGTGQVAFASEIKGLLPLVERTPDLVPHGITEFLEHEFLAGEETVFHGIKRVPPGCAITITRDLQVQVDRYWSAAEQATQIMDLHEAEAHFSSLMEQVMVEHMRADVPFGLFLSGGVDSSVLCALLTRMHGQGIQTYSLGYSVDQARNELDAAHEVASRFATRHVAIELNPEQLLLRLPYVVWSTDELMNDHATLPTSFLAERAAKDLRVVFSGEGGDEVFAGYARYRRRPLQRWAANLLHPGSGGYRTRGLWSKALLKSTFGPALYPDIGHFRQGQKEAWRQGHPSWSSLQKAQHNDLLTSLPDNLLTKVDRNLMAFGLEGRVPFLDHRVVEFGLSLPDDLKVQGSVGKYFLRHWAQRYLPRKYLFTPKKGFHMPVRHLLPPSFVKQLEETLPKLPAVTQWFHAAGVREMLRENQATGKHANEIWALLYFAIWHRIFVEHGGRRPDLQVHPLEYLT